MVAAAKPYGLILLPLCCVFLFLLYFSAYSQDNYSQWSHSRDITINTSASGYNVTSDLTNFPYLVRLSRKNFDFSQAQGQGQDIRFANVSGTHLAYQIARWDSAAGQAVLWVKVDRIFGDNSTQFFKMYWGRNTAADSSNGRRVFETSNGYSAVYHMEEGSGNLQDATANAAALSPAGDVPRSIAGITGNAHSFDGDGDFFEGAGSNAAFNLSTNNTFTVSAWVNRQGSGSNEWEGVVSKFAWSAGNYREYELMYHGDFTLNVSSDGASGTEEVITADMTPSDNAWYLVAGVLDGQNMRLYVNGELKKSAAKTSVFNSATAPFRIGGADGSQCFNGRIDEVTVSKTARSADWIKVSFLNQAGFDVPLGIVYPKNAYTFTTGLFIDSIVPSCDGIADSFSIAPPLPLYMAFNMASGVIVGYPEQASPKTDYVVTAYGRNGTATDTIAITVTSPVATRSASLGQNSGAVPRIIGIHREQGSKRLKVIFELNPGAGITQMEFAAYDVKGAKIGSARLNPGLLKPGLQSIKIPVQSELKTNRVFIMESRVFFSSTNTKSYKYSTKYSTFIMQ